MSFSSPSSSSIGVSSLNTGLGLPGSAPPLQITGLASGLDTNSIISQLMAIQEQPLTNLQTQQKGIQALNSNLQTIQTALQGLVTNAQNLASTTLFSNTQTVTSTNSTVLAASATSGVGAVVGGYQVAISQLASAANQTFSFTSPTAADTLTVGQGGQTKTYSLAAGATAQNFADAVNADSSGYVWATVVNGNIVFSNRTTGSASTFTVSDSGGSLAQQSSVAGLDAQYTVNGGSTQTSSSNSVTTAIPGVTLNFGGVTTGGAPVTVSVGAPSLSTSTIQNAVQAFVSSYNSVLTQIQTQLTQAPSRSDPTQGTLFGDPGLNDLLFNMRQAMYQGGTGLPAGMASMMDIGVSTGATTGSGTFSQSAVNGQLTLDANALTQAITTNPSGVTSVLQAFSSNFANMVNASADAGGTIDSRIQGNSTEITDLGNQISAMQSTLADKQLQLQQQFAALEGALSQNQSTSAWLTSQITSLPLP
ncbi:MAG TPA: flagellar filament capping protein FliD [Solirubrobacteraceae bacterium]|nr:flagellar filament capping protein FliD [Solirubrobacteraceae bacterium]